MNGACSKNPWLVECWDLALSNPTSARISRERTQALFDLGAALVEEEARICPLDIDGQAGLAVIIRDGGKLWVGSRPLMHPHENLEELARVYSVLARGSDATVFTDASGSLLAASAAWRRVYGYTLGELIGQNPRVINSRKHPPQYFQEMWRSLTDPKVGTWSKRLLNRRKNGELVEVWQTITAVRGQGRMIQGYLGQTRDMTELQAAQDQLHRRNEELVQLTRFKGEMMEMMAHDLKSPLQSVLGYADLIGEQGTPPPATHKYAERIREIGKSMFDLVQNFLELQRREVGSLTITPQRGNLRQLLRSVAQGHAINGQARGVKVVLEESGESRPAFFDPVRIEQAVNNLLSNAVKFSPPGTQVTLRLTSQPNAPKRIDVEDQGPGIAPDVADKIFDTYFQASQPRESGSVGWGLAIARKVVDLHAGKIRVENLPTGGCRFSIDLPYGYETCYHTRIWSAVLYDPHSEWSREISDHLEKDGVICFIATDYGDFVNICQHELPSLLILDKAEYHIERIPRMVMPDSGRELSPACAWVSVGCDGALEMAQVSGPKDIEPFPKNWRSARPARGASSRKQVAR